jgi:fluoroquinolone transport system permease protein
MAMGKLSGILMLGLFVPFFIKTNVQYLFAILPSFWIAKLTMEQNAMFFLPGLVCALLWVIPLMSKFRRKIA